MPGTDGGTADSDLRVKRPEVYRAWTTPFRFVLMLSFMSVAIGLSGALIWINVTRVQAQIETSTAERMESLQRLASSVFGDRVRGVRLVQSVLAANPHFDRSNLNSREASVRAARTLAEATAENENITSMFVGYPDGAFIMASKVDRLVNSGENPSPHTETEPGIVDAARHNATFAIRRITSSDTERSDEWIYLDADSDVLSVHVATLADRYDPREREWYVDAQETDEFILTEPYRFATSGLTGITFAAPMFDKAVIGADVRAEFLESLLNDHAITRTSRSALMTGSGRFLAASVGDTSGDVAGVEASEDPVLDRLSSILANDEVNTADRSEGHTPRFDLNGESYVYGMATIWRGARRRVRHVSAAPVSELNTDLEQLLSVSVPFAMLGVAIAAVISIFLGSLLSAPLRRLSEVGSQIATFNFDNTFHVSDSRILEVEDLSESLDEMRQALSLYGRYLPSGIVRQSLHSPRFGRIGGQRREISVLFSDVEGFTTLSEHIDANLLLELVSDYFECTTRAVNKYDGVIDKFIGDGVMALWNGIESQQDHATRACAAALDARRRIAGFNAQSDRAGRPRMRTRFGIHCGECAVGNVGSSDRMNFTALGNTVNIASRLEGGNKRFGTEILVSESVRDNAQDRFAFRSLGGITLRGTSSELQVFELVGEWKHLNSELHPRILTLWQKGLNSYRQGELAKAERVFRWFHTRDASDGPAKYFLDLITGSSDHR